MKIMDPISREEAAQVLAYYGEHNIIKNTKVGMAFSMAVKALEDVEKIRLKLFPLTIMTTDELNSKKIWEVCELIGVGEMPKQPDLVDNSIIIPDNATNGEILMYLFPEIALYFIKHKQITIKKDSDWWKTPFDGGKTE